MLSSIHNMHFTYDALSSTGTQLLNRTNDQQWLSANATLDGATVRYLDEVIFSLSVLERGIEPTA